MFSPCIGCCACGHIEATRTVGKAFSPGVIGEAGRGSLMSDVTLVDVISVVGFVALAVVRVTLVGCM